MGCGCLSSSDEVWYEWEAANQCSQGVAHPSTWPYAGELNFRVRDGYGCCLAALAASTPTDGIEPSSNTSVGTTETNRSGLLTVCIVIVQSSLRLDSFVESQCGPHSLSYDMTVARSVSARGLNDSLPRRVHPESIELFF